MSTYLSTPGNDPMPTAMSSLGIVIMAAGRGKRMYSNLPKVLHTLGGRSLLARVLDTSAILNAKKTIVVYGDKGEQLLDAFKDHINLTWVLQQEQLGTGHAALQALPELANVDKVLILSGDVPLIDKASLEELIKTTTNDSVGLISCEVQNPFGLGRILRDKNGNVTSIVEELDANSQTKAIKEINAALYCFSKDFLATHLPKLKANNANKEYYLTDLIATAYAQKIKINAVKINQEELIHGINDKRQLEQAERFVQKRMAEHLMQKGVNIIDLNRIDIRAREEEIQIGKDVTIDINVILEGTITIGDGSYVGPNTIIKDSSIGSFVEIKANSMLEGATIGDECTVGPFARLRPGTALHAKARIGNFVEIKQSTVGSNSKINHLSYIGDCTIGSKVNIGAGTITCNYDGVNKFKTVIEDNVFVGSDTQLIAPVTIGKNATIAAGTTVIKDAPANKLTINAKTQSVVENWKRPDTGDE